MKTNHLSRECVIHTQCRLYRGSMPCRFHKSDGRLCEDCSDYDPVREKILIVKLAAVGDVLRTTSILPRIKEMYPEAEITWLTKANAVDLIEGNPLIDRTLVVEGDYLSYLVNEHFSIGICLDADQQSATVLSIAQCQIRLGFIVDRFGKVLPANHGAIDWWLMGLNDERKKSNRKTYQQMMYQICELPMPSLPPQLYLTESDLDFGLRFFEKTGLSDHKCVIGINTGGGHRWALKKWTLDGYVDCMRQLRVKFPDVGLLLLGGPEEVELNQRIHDNMKGDVVDSGCRNSLLEFASLIQGTHILLTSDSLGMHIGVALKKSTFVLVGPTAPWELEVFGLGKVIYSDLHCVSCYRSRCQKTINCMNSISSKLVVEEISKELHRRMGNEQISKQLAV